jgi:deoxycytidylate deaminase
MTFWDAASLDLEYMREARRAMRDSTCKKKQLGCVLKFTDGSYVQGTNGSPKVLKPCSPCPRLGNHSATNRWNCRAVHAERQVLLKAAKNGFATDGAILYSYMGVPCKDCLLELIEAGISEIVCTRETYYDELSKDILKEWIDVGGKFRVLGG